MSIGVMPARPPFVIFEERSIEDRNASIKENRLMMKSVDFVVVRQLGSKDSVEKDAIEWLDDLDRNVARGAYPREWATAFRKKFEEWKAGREAPLNGFPLREWSRLSKARCENYASLGLFTVEDVAAMNEPTMQKMGMGSRAERDSAIAFLETRSGAVNSEEVAALRAANEDMKQQIADLREAIAATGAATKTKPAKRAAEA